MFFNALFLLTILNSELPPPLPTSLYDITAQTIDKGQVLLRAYQGRVLLIVDIDVKGSLAPQIVQLEEIYNTYGDKGFSVLAFPTNDFTSGTPVSPDEIKELSYDLFKITYPLFEPVHVTGAKRHPVYQFLTNNRTNPVYGGEVSWSFTKFLVDKDGKVIGRFGSKVVPNDPKITEAIENALK